MIGVTSAHLEGLIRLEMKPFEIRLDLMDIHIERTGDDWRACIDRETAREHPDCLAALTRAVLRLKMKYCLEK